MNKTLVLAVLLSVVMTGCQNSKTSGSEPSQSEAASKKSTQDSSSEDIETGDSRSETKN